MEKYYLGAILGVDRFLGVLTLGLAFFILAYKLIAAKRDQLRYRRLGYIIDKLQVVAYTDSPAVVGSCSLFVHKTSDFEFLNILKHRVGGPHGEFPRPVAECIGNSGKISRVENTARRSGNKWRRIEAILMLGHLNSAPAVDILKTSLFHKDADIAYFSALALGYTKKTEAAELLLTAIQKRVISGQTAAAILEGFGPAIAGHLIASAQSGDEPLRFWSIKLLARLKPRYDTAEIAAFVDDPSPNVRAAACECLGEAGEKNSALALRRCLSDREWYVRLYAIKALEKVMGPESVGEVAGFIGDGHWFIRESVKEIMAKYGA